jgi:hypothetical protein
LIGHNHTRKLPSGFSVRKISIVLSPQAGGPRHRIASTPGSKLRFHLKQPALIAPVKAAHAATGDLLIQPHPVSVKSKNKPETKPIY